MILSCWRRDGTRIGHGQARLYSPVTMAVYIPTPMVPWLVAKKDGCVGGGECRGIGECSHWR